MYKALLITSNHLRHKFVANKISSNLNLCAIVSEEKTASNSHSNERSNRENEIIQKHFDQRDRAEKNLLGEIHSFPNSVKLLNVKRGESNSNKVFEWIQNQKPDVLILYGSGIIKAPLLDHYNNRIINLHLGLSPYYRGSATNFWPLVDGYPECVGATIHLATKDVDAGGILVQVRPRNIGISDGPHELGAKTIIAGTDMMYNVIPFYLKKEVIPVKQDLSIGKVYKRKDFNAEAVVNLWQNFEDGLIKEYLVNKKERDEQFPIVEPKIL